MCTGGVANNKSFNKKKIDNKKVSLINSIVIKDSVIDQRSDGYINISALFKITTKLYKSWRKSLATREFLEALSNRLNRPITSLLKVKKGIGDNYAHPLIALDIASYISPEYRVLIYEFILENEELFYKNLARDLNFQKEDLAGQVSELNKSSLRINKKRNWHKFSKNFSFYIVKFSDDPLIFKLGISSNIDNTLAGYRRLSASVEIIMLIYFNTEKDMNDFDICQSRAFEPHKILQSKEQIFGLSLNEVLEKVDAVIEFQHFGNKTTKETEINIEKYNKDVYLVKEIIDEFVR